jgi:hypothetical protein
MTISLGKAAPVSRAELHLNKLAQAHDHKVAVGNAKFAKASPARKRVIIAKDVLEWLGEGKLLPTQGTYLSSFLRDKDGQLLYEDGRVVNGRVLDDRVDGGKCTACALGAVFACTVERKGGMPNFWRMGWCPYFMHQELAPYFDRDQLTLIEAAFEKNGGFHEADHEADHEAGEAAESFGRRFDTASSRMAAIMKNIIANGGTFVP